ncbi:hypothetical protein JL09_g4983 [Pichia kudriavzevii]|uniref:Uncharacterized protein n=1 Tax=Pichia kudriavzevii TaxID=4909 RepID=A0A099NVB8_PICKU|nr:hypothetical protein JL09_g4983 [Pichia kudriavzevii]
MLGLSLNLIKLANLSILFATKFSLKSGCDTKK